MTSGRAVIHCCQSSVNSPQSEFETGRKEGRDVGKPNKDSNLSVQEESNKERKGGKGREGSSLPAGQAQKKIRVQRRTGKERTMWREYSGEHFEGRNVLFLETAGSVAGYSLTGGN